MLWLSGNQLTGLPDAIGRLTQLTELSLSGNQLRDPPADIVEQGARAVVAYLAEKEPLEPVFEAKIVLVGEPRRGKTQFRGWLQHNRLIDLPEDGTRGGELGSCCVHLEVAGHFVPVTLNIWDFGGQDKYRSAQQPLFTSGALYLLFCKGGRPNLSDERVDEWLRLIQQRAGPEAHVLLVVTHMEPRAAMPRVALPEDLERMIKGRYAIDSLAPDHRLDDLIERIEADVQTLPGFGQPWRRSYIAARNEILDLRPPVAGEDAARRPLSAAKPWLPFHELAAICERHGLSRGEARTLASIMARHGRVDFKAREGDGNPMVVLDPEWLLKASARIIDCAAVAARGGVLDEDVDLPAVWGCPDGADPLTFEPAVWADLMKLLSNHGQLFWLAGREWVFGYHAPPSPPQPPDSLWTEPADGRRLRLECDLEWRIDGLMALLTVLHHYKHVRERPLPFWHHGVFLRHPARQSEGMILVEGERRVSLEARGPDAAELMLDMRRSLELIVAERWEGFVKSGRRPMELFVPCQHPGCTQRCAMEAIESRRAARERTVYCDRRNHENAIDKLLLGIEEAADGGYDDDGRRRERGPSDRSERQQRAMETRLVQSQITYDQPPRAFLIAEPPADTRIEQARNAAMVRAKVQLLCELSHRPVPGAEGIISRDRAWFDKVRRFGPGMLVSGARILGKGMLGLPPDPSDLPNGGSGRERDPGDAFLGLPTGEHWRPDGEAYTSDDDDFLKGLAKAGNMRQTQDRISGRWQWASKEHADLNDAIRPGM